MMICGDVSEGVAALMPAGSNATAPSPMLTGFHDADLSVLGRASGTTSGRGFNGDRPVN